MATGSVDIELTNMPAQSSSGEQSKGSKTMGDDVQLRTIIGEATDDAEEITERINETSLAPVDRGFGAWSFLAAAVIVDAVVWGFPNTYGVFLAKYLDDPYWSSQNKASFLLPLVGPLSSGIMYCTGPITYPLVARYPRHRRTSMWLGLVVIFASLLGASYARTIVSLVALQGVLYGIGGALLYAPTIYYMSEWFRIRRGLANGVIDAGTAVGGLILPLILPPLLNKHSTSKTLRYLSIAQGTLLLVTVPFIRGRLPVNRVQGPSARGYRSSIVTRAYARNKTFWIIILATLLQGLAYYIPVLWLPTYASSLRLSPSSASLALALLNGTSVIGRISLGMLSDRFSPWLLASSTLLCTALTVFVLWGLFSYTFAGIIVYGIAYGFLASGYQSLWTAFVRPIAKDDPTISTTIFGFLMLSRGIGNILSTPISTALQPARSPLSPSPSPPAGYPHVHEIGFKIDGGQYEKVIVYAGSCFVAAAAVIAAGWVVERRYPSSSNVNTTRR